jgi:hypothetical protein
MKSCGVVYCLTGPRVEAPFDLCFSILSLRQYWKGGISVLTSIPLVELEFLAEFLDVDLIAVFTPEMPPRFQSRFIKTSLGRFTPYDHSIFLDLDTIVSQSVDRLFEYEMAMAIDARPTVGESMKYLRELNYCEEAESQQTLDICSAEFPHYNSGVFVWKTGDASQRLFDRWHQEWRIFGERDQAALARTLVSTNIKPTVLPSRYNYFGELGGPLSNSEVVVWHGCCQMDKHQRLFPNLYSECRSYMPPAFRRSRSPMKAMKALVKRFRHATMNR